MIFTVTKNEDNITFFDDSIKDGKIYVRFGLIKNIIRNLKGTDEYVDISIKRKFNIF